MRWIDAHCHLADPRLKPELAAVLERSRQAGISGWIQGGVGPEDWKSQRELQKLLGKQDVLTSFGLHPWWVIQAPSEAEIRSALAELDQALPQAAALGELGLDFSEKSGGKLQEPRQRKAFQDQLALNRKHRKPLVLHVVKAHAEAIEILEAEGPSHPGLVHSFSASREVAERYLKLGLLLSVSGVVTRPGYETLKRAIRAIPGDRLVVETDCPDQPPAGSAESLNEPARLRQIAEAIGALRGEKAEAVLDRSASNLRNLFPELKT